MRMKLCAQLVGRGPAAQGVKGFDRLVMGFYRLRVEDLLVGANIKDGSVSYYCTSAGQGADGVQTVQTQGIRIMVFPCCITSSSCRLKRRSQACSHSWPQRCR